MKERRPAKVHSRKIKVEIPASRFFELVDSDETSREATFKDWGLQRCVHCPHCRFFYYIDPDATWRSREGYYRTYPHCMYMSKIGREVRETTNKSLGCPNKCPLLKSEDKVEAKLARLTTVLENKVAQLETLESDISKLQLEILKLQGGQDCDRT